MMLRDMYPPEKGYVMTEHSDTDQSIATITNRNNPSQIISIKYLKPESAFCTSGIQNYLGVKEIFIPMHMVAKDTGQRNRHDLPLCTAIRSLRKAIQSYRSRRVYEVGRSALIGRPLHFLDISSKGFS
jgi:hypothetical protein